jgi:hypothetical protein
MEVCPVRTADNHGIKLDIGIPQMVNRVETEILGKTEFRHHCKPASSFRLDNSNKDNILSMLLYILKILARAVAKTDCRYSDHKSS